MTDDSGLKFIDFNGPIPPRPDRSELIAYAATDLAAPPTYSADNFVKCRGEPLSRIIWQGRQWAVTSYGIECRDGTYVIEKSRLWENEVNFGWVQHMAGKVWTDLPDFAEALRIARHVHSETAPATKADDIEMLTSIFKQGPLQQWTVEEIMNDKLMRFAQAYLMMARAGYRPAAPSDGCGNIQLSLDQCRDRERLYLEAVKYALKFNREEDAYDGFNVGCSNYDTNRAFVLCIEAARLLAGGSDGDQYATRLLKLAIKEIAGARRAQREWERKPAASRIRAARDAGGSS